MRKEVLFAIIGGSILGLIIAFGVWRANVALTPDDTSPQESSSPTPKPEFIISIAKPSALDVYTDNPVEISGITKAGSVVVAIGEEDDVLTQTDGQGSFSQEIDLIGGVNQLILSAFDANGSQTDLALSLVFSSEFEKYVSQGKIDVAPSQTATDSVRGKVEEQIRQAKASPTSYMGTVTDITEGTIQLKSPDGQIRQISTSSDTSSVKIGSKTQEIKLSDIAIGDYIVAMGFKNGNGVLDAKRILVITPPEKPATSAIYVKVISNSKNTISAETIKGQEAKSIVAAKGASISLNDKDGSSRIKFSDIGEGDILLAVGEPAKDKFEARSLFVVKKD